MVLSLLLAIAAAIAIAVVVALRRALRNHPGATSLSADGQRHAATVTRRRVLAALGVGGVAAAVSLVLGDALDASYGLPILLAPACFAIGVAATIAIMGVPMPATDAPREVGLVPRRPWSFGPGWAYVAPAVSVAAAITFAIVAGLTSSKADDGTWRSFTVEFENGSAGGGPYPGWFYGVPLIIVTILLFAATCVALARLSSAPLRGTEEDRALSSFVRRQLARFVLLAGTGSLLVYFGGSLTFAGLVVSNVSRAGIEGVDLTGLMVLGGVEFITGLVFGLFGVVLVFIAISMGWAEQRRAIPAPAKATP